MAPTRGSQWQVALYLSLILSLSHFHQPRMRSKIYKDFNSFDVKSFLSLSKVLKVCPDFFSFGLLEMVKNSNQIKNSHNKDRDTNILSLPEKERERWREKKTVYEQGEREAVREMERKGESDRERKLKERTERGRDKERERQNRKRYIARQRGKESERKGAYLSFYKQ